MKKERKVEMLKLVLTLLPSSLFPFLLQRLLNHIRLFQNIIHLVNIIGIKF